MSHTYLSLLDGLPTSAAELNGTSCTLEVHAASSG